MDYDRRSFFRAAGLATVTQLVPTSQIAERSTRVLVWDERQEAQKQAYGDFLGNTISDHLRKQPGMSVRSVALDDPDQGISEAILNETDVLIWWGHQRQTDLQEEKASLIVSRIVAGKLSLIALHSAHWSTPFIQCMIARTKSDAEKQFGTNNTAYTYMPPADQYKAPAYDTRLTPYCIAKKFPDGRQAVEIHGPICCFPAYGRDSQPSRLNVMMPGHPIAKGLPLHIDIPQTELYDEHFHVPDPDQVVFEERWPMGEWFRSGMVWQIGKGRVFYFRPGHELYPIYKQKWPLQILVNAVQWMGM